MYVHTTFSETCVILKIKINQVNILYKGRYSDKINRLIQKMYMCQALLSCEKRNNSFFSLNNKVTFKKIIYETIFLHNNWSFSLKFIEYHFLEGNTSNLVIFLQFHLCSIQMQNLFKLWKFIKKRIDLIHLYRFSLYST